MARTGFSTFAEQKRVDVLRLFVSDTIEDKWHPTCPLVKQLVLSKINKDGDWPVGDDDITAPLLNHSCVSAAVGLNTGAVCRLAPVKGLMAGSLVMMV